MGRIMHDLHHYMWMYDVCVCIYVCMHIYRRYGWHLKNSDGNWSETTCVKVYCMYVLAFTYLFKPNFAVKVHSYMCMHKTVYSARRKQYKVKLNE